MSVATRPTSRRRADPLGVLAGAARATSLGLYIHVPFCLKRCYYCSFNTAPFRDDEKDRYVRALGGEIDLLAGAGWAAGIGVETIFFGGGTPSLLESSELADILERVRRRFTVRDDAEVTVECNPE